ncbi:MAG: glycosyltransferase family 4 protein, partial [Candidatus Bathyarchaeota archaeon]
DLGYRVVAQLHYPTVTGIDSLPARALYRPTIWNLARRQEEVEAFIAHGPREREWLKGEDIDERRIVIARYPAVPSPLFGYQCKPLPEMDSIGEPIVLYLGRITWRKGVHVLIEAAESLRKETPDVRLVIAGPAEEGYLERIRRDVERRGLRDIVDFKGVLSEEEKYNYMGAATVFVSPSIKDIHPITLLEAQALGTPVISTDIAAIPDIVKDGSTGFLVEPENAEALKETIKKILDNPPLRETLSQEARTWASSFALENTVDTLENLYKNITESHR